MLFFQHNEDARKKPTLDNLAVIAPCDFSMVSSPKRTHRMPTPIELYSHYTLFNRLIVVEGLELANFRSTASLVSPQKSSTMADCSLRVRELPLPASGQTGTSSGRACL